MEAKCICAACLWSWKFHAHSDPNGKQMTACVCMCSLWRLDVKSNTRIKQTQTYTASDDPQKLAPIHQIETVFSKALTCPRTPRGHVPMATPLAVPVVDLPVAWWPWRPRHSSRRHRRHHCIIASSRCAHVFGFLLFEENLFYF